MKRGNKNRKKLLIYLWKSLEKRTSISFEQTHQVVTDKINWSTLMWTLHDTFWGITGFLPGNPRLKPIETTTSGKFSSTDPTFAWWKGVTICCNGSKSFTKITKFHRNPVMKKTNELKSESENSSLLDIFHLFAVGLFFPLWFCCLTFWWMECTQCCTDPVFVKVASPSFHGCPAETSHPQCVYTETCWLQSMQFWNWHIQSLELDRHLMEILNDAPKNADTIYAWYMLAYLLLHTVSQGFLERFLNVLCKKDVFSLTTDVFLHPAQVCYLDVQNCNRDLHN